ncbi:urease accessory protein UreD [Yersinia pestis subsp. pestis]|uniref:Urease accessory protein UreD n=5 Tax=Yersinia pestis TaxID=632 RepID=URED_YERPA|nr:urease accessory protein UreD [Yersinia pestis]Q1C5A9.1 RecName: Full=Urease accessory protein UreD [Yersinia pestis Antiqua]Q1CKJ5.1 RecName: Full=Urease accessory protein UreD [Yersinia pestis Nepal516]Q9ZFR5.1 PUTATIVE PSEUDOGENE: RecName: Full=Putative urease accessory protein UreD [Yersinia pestis]EFA49033.1 urease accessory protein UreD [Yersinia pestis KIM D27]ETO49101.1 urease accessory protein UreD [Yersinia pestis S3]AAC78638.1 urease accessory protein UreD [Yersinia pestis]ABG1
MTAQSQNIVETPSRVRAHALGVNAPELAKYQDEPAQMRSGAVGKSGYLKLRFAKREHCSILAEMERRVPSLVQKALYWDEEIPELPCVTMISTSGCILQGDRLATDVHVEAGACAHVTTQSATKVHMMNANYASQIQNFIVEEGGYLEFMPDPLIPHRNSRFITDTTISIHPTATAIYSEVLMSGRKYHHADERFGFDVYSSRVAAQNLAGKELFVEKYVLEPKVESLDAVGVMQTFDAFGNVILLTPKEHHDRILARVPAHFDIKGGDCQRRDAST